jgi:hypothetical protein
MNDGLFTALCLTAIIGLGVPAFLYAAARRGNQAGQIELTKRVAKRAMNPWKPEDDSLAELSKRVEGLDKPKGR